MDEKTYSDSIINESSSSEEQNEGFTWIDFYTKFATKLLQYKSDRDELINKIKPVIDDFFSVADQNCPRLAKDGEELIDIDPFTIFALFNWRILSDDLRKLFITNLASKFEIEADIPKKFYGIPTAFNMGVAYYNTQGKRKEHDIDNLWELFEAALVLEGNDEVLNRQEFSKYFDKVFNQSAIGLSKLTTGLFWIRPNYFLPLDQNTYALITSNENLPDDFLEIAKGKLLTASGKKVSKLKAEDYLEIRDACEKVLETGEYKYKTFPELSYAAWNNKDNQKNKKDSNISTDLGKNVETPNENVSKIRDVLIKIMNEYVPAKTEEFTGHPLGIYYKKTIPQILYDTGLIDKEKYLVKGSVGEENFNNWADVSWFAIMNKGITKVATKGVYIVYLLSKNGESVYLTFNQGCKEIEDDIHKQGILKGNSQQNRVIEVLRQNANEIRKKISNLNFSKDDKINLGENLSNRALFYQNGTIFYKEYKKDNVPPEEELLEDLKNMLRIYDEYAKTYGYEKGLDFKSAEPSLPPKEIVSKINDYIESKGFIYIPGMIENFYLSLKSKPFVILAGVSGTGKTRLARLFAEAVGANNENKRYLQVPVRPDWSDSSDLFGYKNLNNEFVHGAIIDFIVSAGRDKENPYFLCLDEMNLARVEYYLSDILSLIETRSFVGDEIKTDSITNPAHPKEEAFQTISIPDNFYIVGTVNMDETTFPFSKKVLDRANTIEFSDVDLKPQLDFDKTDITAQDLENAYFKAKYLLLKDCIDEDEEHFVVKNCQKLQEINEILKEANAQFGYRVRDEIIFYLLNNKNDDLISNEDAFDNAIMQKILPRIQGSSQSVRSILCKLFSFCAGNNNSSKQDTADIDKKISEVLNDSKESTESLDCLYKKSAKKTAFMVRRFDEDGFTSYWF